MSIDKISNNVTNLGDYKSSQKRPQKNVPQADVIVDLNSDSSEKEKRVFTYTNPKNSTNAELWNQYAKFTNKHIGRQLSGLKAYIQGYIDGNQTDPIDVEKLQQTLKERYGIVADLDPANVAEGGKYSAENLSDTFVQFAKNLSGGDPAKADMLLDAVKKGFEIAERAWGGALPEISQKTYELTIEKFEAWKSESTQEV